MTSFKLVVLGSSLLSLASANPVTEAPMPRLERRQAAACSSFLDIESSCEAATPSFTDLALSSQVDCLCSPASVFDNAFSSCLRYLSTAEPDLYSSFDNLPSTPCALLGGTITESSTTSTSTRSRSSSSSSGSGGGGGAIDTDDPNYQACATLISLEDDCSSATPRFTNLGATQQASCYCYEGTSYAPEIYDANRESCISYLQSADPPSYQSLVQQGGAETSLCSSIGDVRGDGPTTSSSPTRPTPTSTRVPTGAGSPTSSSTGGVAPTGIAGGTASVFAAFGTLALAIFL